MSLALEPIGTPAAVSTPAPRLASLVIAPEVQEARRFAETIDA